MPNFDIEVIFNQFEALLWLSISLALLVHALIQKLRRRPLPASQLFLIPAFALFGISDLIEATTGAWWRPWWLLLIKAFCILIFLIVFANYRKKQGKKPVERKAQ